MKGSILLDRAGAPDPIDAGPVGTRRSGLPVSDSDPAKQAS